MKEFDSCLKGKPFVFRLGDGDVIKGWDEGVEGTHLQKCQAQESRIRNMYCDFRNPIVNRLY